MEPKTSLIRGVKRTAASLTESDEVRIKTFLDWCKRECLGVSEKVGYLLYLNAEVYQHGRKAGTAKYQM